MNKKEWLSNLLWLMNDSQETSFVDVCGWRREFKNFSIDDAVDVILRLCEQDGQQLVPSEMPAPEYFVKTCSSVDSR
jgi:hypothetical protein